MVSKVLAILFSLLILGQAYAVRRLVGTWVFPACLFGLFWFGFTFFPLLFFFQVPIQPYAVGFIWLCTLAFSASFLLFDWKTALRRNDAKRPTAGLVYGNAFLRIALYFTSVSAFLFVLLDLREQGISLYDLVFHLQDSAIAYANMLYGETLNVNIFSRLTLVFAYTAAALGGFVFPCAPTRLGRWFVGCLSVLPGISVALTQTGKGLLLFSIALFYAGFLASRVAAGSLTLFDRRHIKSVITLLVIVVLLVAMAFATRAPSEKLDSTVLLHTAAYYFGSYSCVHLYAFSDWFSFTIGQQSQLSYLRVSSTHGFFTFMTLFQMAGMNRDVPLGVYDDYFTYRDLLTGNIYTIFRGLIQDFGLIGTIIFMFVAGFVFHFAFSLMLRQRRPVLTVVIFLFMVAFFYESFVISIFGWTRMYVAFVFLWFIMILNDLFSRRFAMIARTVFTKSTTFPV